MKTKPKPDTMQITRKDFIRDTAFITAGLSFLPQKLFADGVSEEKGFDYIIVGAGASGVIVAQRLVEAGKKVLLIEAGGPTSKAVGGNDYPEYIKDGSRTIFDVPGEYGNIAWLAKGDKYKIKEAGFTYQGMGYGGNTQFNGMLFQMAPAYDFDKNWPTGWKSGDLRPYAERILGKMNVTNKPSADGKHYLSAGADAVHAAYKKNGFAEKDSSVLGGIGDRYYSYPYVVSKNGLRGGPVEAYLESIVDERGESRVANFTIFRLCKVDKILFDSKVKNKAVGVSLVRRKELKDLDNSGEKKAEVALLKSGGRVILAAGALITPRLLLLSGIGPKARAGEIYKDGFSAPIHIDNPNLAVGLHDHVGSMISYEYTGENTYKTYNYALYAENAKDIERFIKDNVGPYTQFGPVSVAHDSVGSSDGQANVEYFVNALGAGTAGQPYHTSKDFSVFTMLLRPKARDVLHIGKDSFVQYPMLYLTNDEDLTLMAQAVQKLIRVMKSNPNFKLKLGPGGLSHPNMNAENLQDVKNYLAAWDPFRTPNGSAAHFSRLIMNHWGGTAPIGKAVNAKTLVVEGTQNIHVVDASLIPAPLSAHPVATIMAIAEKAADDLLAMTVATNNVLKSGQELRANKSIVSPNGKTKLTFQADGNLVVYRDGKALWATGTWNKGAVRAVMQADGNLVVYTADNKALWASGTAGKKGAFLRLEDSSNLLILLGSTRVWQSGSKV